MQPTSALRRHWRNGITFASEIRFALAASLVWALAYNAAFWQQTLGSMGHATVADIGFLVSLFVLILFLQALLLLLMPNGTLMRVAASVLFIVAAIGSYFCSAYGAIMSQDMLRNAIATDAAEVADLLNGKLIATVVLGGVLPAILVWWIRVPTVAWTQRLKWRALYFGALVVVCGSGLFLFSANYAMFLREHKPIRYTLMPAAPVTSFVGLLSKGSSVANQALLETGGKAVRVADTRGARPLVIFFVVGETARAENFQLGGYDRPTNPQLRGIEKLAYFPHASSCGTSTAFSLPCMFSHTGREDFDVDVAARSTNLLDALQQAGFDVEWRDNNSGCKGVCARVVTVDYSARKGSSLCPNSFCYDEIMLTDLADRLAKTTRDTVIVFHQVGSHGPAYSERYPPDFERFTPACRSNQLQSCSEQEVVNAYDNSIAYTDHVLAEQIAILREASNHLDTMLIYASDHGESLGEQGIYLHGMPYRLAPQTQKDVPMLLWTSTSYDERVRLQADCVKAQTTEAVSHDNLYHTILGAAGVRNQVYDAERDLLSQCRNEAVLARR